MADPGICPQIYGVLAGLWLAQGLTQPAISPLVFWLAALFAIASAGYSAFLFAQARGRDFWQSPLLFWHLLMQSISAGAAVLIVIGSLELITPFQFMSAPMFSWLGNALVVSLCAGLAMIFSDLFMNHGSEELRRSAELLSRGALWKQFWIFAVLLGIVVPLVLMFWPTRSLLPNMVASLLVLSGLWIYENLWIKAGQSVPLS
jgi:formate-dependent nitrite reductase membrane component NrfD